MAQKKYKRRRRKKGECKTAPFFQSDSAAGDTGEASFFLPADEKAQAKLKVSEPGDRQEQEADRMASHVMRAKAADDKMQPAAAHADEAQRRTAPAEDNMQKKGREDEKISKKEDEKDKVHKKPKEEETIARKLGPDKEDDTHDHDQVEHHAIATKQNGGSPAAAAPARSSIPTEGGTPLSSGLQSEMSASFGFDFSKVRIHTDQEAQQLSEQLHAQAFAYRGDIFFNEGSFDPSTERGRWLLAHELTHVVQQTGTTPAMNAPTHSSPEIAGGASKP